LLDSDIGFLYTPLTIAPDGVSDESLDSLHNDPLSGGQDDVPKKFV
jgi:hypothetical protein